MTEACADGARPGMSANAVSEIACHDMVRALTRRFGVTAAPFSVGLLYCTHKRRRGKLFKDKTPRLRSERKPASLVPISTLEKGALMASMRNLTVAVIGRR